MIKYETAALVNESINNSTLFKEDPELYSKEEFWVVALREGDCEDYALAKRKILINEENSEHLHLATCWTESGEYHAVLVVDTERGQYVLDNRHSKPQKKEHLPYKWHKIQDGNKWFEIV